MTDSSMDRTNHQPIILSRWNPLLLLQAVEISINNNRRRKRKQYQILSRCNTFARAVEITEDGTDNNRKTKKYVGDSTSNNRKEKQEKQLGGSICNSFVDILIEILSRLPASSLSRFRFVCKLWLTLITTDPILPKMHLDRGFESAGCRSIVIRSVYKKNYHLTIIDQDGGHKRTVLTMESTFVKTSPSCNGLLCIYSRNNTFWLFNPTNGQKLKLPRPNAKSNRCFTSCFLAYIPTTKQYKVLRFVFPPKSRPLWCEVLTVGTCSWRQIAPPDFGEPAHFGGFVINNFMYCNMISLEGNMRRHTILSFDFNEEKFNAINFPKSLARGSTISEFEGRLCVTVPNGCKSIQIWLLVDSVSHAWIHRYTVSTTPPEVEFWKLQPVLFHQGKILIRSPWGLHYRDLETGKFLGYIHREETMISAQVHIESLVSLEALAVIDNGVSSLA